MESFHMCILGTHGIHGYPWTSTIPWNPCISTECMESMNVHGNRTGLSVSWRLFHRQSLLWFEWHGFPWISMNAMESFHICILGTHGFHGYPCTSKIPWNPCISMHCMESMNVNGIRTLLECMDIHGIHGFMESMNIHGYPWYPWSPWQESNAISAIQGSISFEVLPDVWRNSQFDPHHGLANFMSDWLLDQRVTKSPVISWLIHGAP